MVQEFYFHLQTKMEKEQLIQQQIQQQQQKTGSWQLIAGGLLIFTLITFTVGIILGSLASKNAKQTHPRK